MNKQGFSLIEVLVALAILGITMVLLVGVLSGGIKFNQYATDKSKQAFTVEKQVENDSYTSQKDIALTFDFSQSLTIDVDGKINIYAADKTGYAKLVISNE